MEVDGGMPPLDNVSLTLTAVELITFKTHAVRGPTIGNICVSFGSDPVSGSGDIEFTIFL